LEGPGMGRCRGIDRPKHGLREPGLCLASTVTRSVFVVLKCAVMVEVPVFGCHFVEGGLLDGGMRSSQPGECRDGLGEEHDQHQGIRRHNPQQSAIEEQTLVRRPGHRSPIILYQLQNFEEHPLRQVPYARYKRPIVRAAPAQSPAPSAVEKRGGCIWSSCEDARAA
jgi:hypothetical protein